MNALATAVQRTFKPPREVSASGMSFIQHAEGEPGTGKPMLTAYQDDKGVWTIGWGHTAGVVPGMRITVGQAIGLLDSDLDQAENAVATMVLVPLNDNQFDALVSLVFNIGVEAFRASTLLRVLNQGRYDLVPAEMARWNKIKPKGKPSRVVPGLTNRRASEAALFLTVPSMLPLPLLGTVDAAKRLGSNDPQEAPDFSQVEASVVPDDENITMASSPAMIPVAATGPSPAVELSNITPTPPANSVVQTPAGKTGIAALFAGAGGLVTEGYAQLQPLIDAWRSITWGTAGLGSWAKVIGVVFIVGALGFTAWSLWQQHRKLSGRKV
jgi:lysozyme